MRRPPKHAAPAASRLRASTARARTAGGGRLRGAGLAWQGWRLSRPFWGAVLAVCGAAELAMAGGMWHWLRTGEGPLLAGPADWLLVGAVMTCAAALCFNPVHRSAYSTAIVLAAVAGLSADHVGGYLAGSALIAVGGALAFAWVPAAQPEEPGDTSSVPDQAVAPGEVTMAALPAPTEPATAPSKTAPDRPLAGQGPELTVIRGEAVTVPASSAGAQPPTSALGLSTAED